MKLLLARHGQSQWQTRVGELTPFVPLTELGERQAHTLGAYLAQSELIHAVVTSTMRRAQHTAEIVASYLGLTPVEEHDLREFEEWEEGGWSPLPVSMWDPAPAVPEFSPAYGRFRARVAEALKRAVASMAPDQTLLIVAHGGTIGVILRLILGSDTPRLWAANTALHLVEWDRPEWGASWVVHYLNNLEHLPVELRTS